MSEKEKRTLYPSIRYHPFLSISQRVLQRLHPPPDILGKFFIRIFGIPRFHPDITGCFAALPAVLHTFVVHGAVINRTRLPFRHMKHLSAAFLTTFTHFPETITGTAVRSAYTQTHLMSLSFRISHTCAACLSFYHSILTKYPADIVYFRHDEHNFGQSVYPSYDTA